MKKLYTLLVAVLLLVSCAPILSTAIDEDPSNLYIMDYSSRLNQTRLRSVRSTDTANKTSAFFLALAVDVAVESMTDNNNQNDKDDTARTTLASEVLGIKSSIQPFFIYNKSGKTLQIDLQTEEKEANNIPLSVQNIQLPASQRIKIMVCTSSQYHLRIWDVQNEIVQVYPMNGQLQSATIGSEAVSLN